MRPNRGSFNRETGKTTPRAKGKTHWGGSKASVAPAKPSKPAASKPAAAKKK